MIKKRERGRTIDGVGVRCMICVDRTGSVCDSNDLQGTCFWTISNSLGGGGGLHHTYSKLRVVLGVVLGVVLEK